MAIVFILPGALREFAGNRDEVRVSGAARTVAEALSLLWAECPAARDRVMTERGELRPHINVFVDGENIRYVGALGAAVHEESEIVLLPAVSGGC